MKTPPFNLKINISWRMHAYLASLHILLVVTLLIVPMSLSFVLAGVIAVVLHWRYSCLCFVSVKHVKWVRRIEYRDQAWILNCIHGQVPVRLRQATVWRWLVLMNFYCDKSNRHYPILLWSDSVDSGELRRLRTTLRHMNVFSRF